MGEQNSRFYEFGPFRLDSLKGLLLREGAPVPLTQKAFKTLLILVQNSRQVVSKNELMSKVWPDTIVEENNLTQSISLLRKALGENRKEHRYIVTAQGQGYLFVASVKEIPEASTNLNVLEPITSGMVINEEAGAGHSSGVEQAAPLTVINSLQSHLRSWPPKTLILFALLSGLIALPLYLWLANKTKARQPQTNEARARSLAVLPFKSLSSEGDDNHLGSGIADALITKLSNIRDINVRPTRAVLQYDGSTQSPLTAGRELQVDAVLDGSIQKAGDRVRVTVQLVSVRDEKPLWAGSFDEQSTNIFAIQDSISEQVARALMIELTGATQRFSARHQTVSAEAYQAYLKGCYFWNKRTEAGLRKAVDYFEQAVAADPTYALAYAGMADSYALIAIYYSGAWPPGEACRRAKAAALQALELDETLAEAHTSLAAWFVYNEDLANAEREFKRALELNPGYATAHQWYGEVLRLRQRFDEGLMELKRAQELDPLSPAINSSLGTSFYFTRQFDQMIQQNRKALELDPHFAPAHLGLGLALEQKGFYEEAIAEFQKAKDLSGGSEPIIAALAHAYAITGKRSKAQRMFAELQERSQRKAVSPFNRALFYAGFGERDQAFVWLQKAQQEQSEFPMLKADPRLDELRADPKFQTLLTAQAL